MSTLFTPLLLNSCNPQRQTSDLHLISTCNCELNMMGWLNSLLVFTVYVWSDVNSLAHSPLLCSAPDHTLHKVRAAIARHICMTDASVRCNCPSPMNICCCHFPREGSAHAKAHVRPQAGCEGTYVPHTATQALFSFPCFIGVLVVFLLVDATELNK